ncbi:MAG: hypothetical protein WCI55_08820 [Armatimonadota bacterium]
MDGFRHPVLVVFELDSLVDQVYNPWEQLRAFGVMNIHRLGIKFPFDLFEEMKFVSIWSSADCEKAFRSNILPKLAQSGIHLRYQIYPIRQLLKTEVNSEYKSSRWTLCN